MKTLMDDSEYVIFASHKPLGCVLYRLNKLGIQYKQLIGCYKGEQGLSYIVTKPNFERLKEQTDVLSKQESFLYMSKPEVKTNQRFCVLVYQKDTCKNQSLGYMRSVTDSEARKHDSYSIDLADYQHYVV